MDSMGKKTVFACGFVAGMGSIVLLSKILTKIRLKKALNFTGFMFRKCDHLLHRLISREELEPVELWLLVNRVEDVRLGKPIEQAVVVINDRTLQKLNKSKWVSASLKQEQQEPFDIIETSPPLFQVNPSMQAACFLAVCDGYSSIYLLGGQYYWTRASNSSSSKVTYCLNVTNVVSGKKEEEAQHSYPIPRVRNRRRNVRAAVTSGRRIYVFGRSHLVYGPGPDYDDLTFGEIYDMDEKCWTDLEKVPFKGAPQFTVIGCVMWRSIIVLFLQRTFKIRRGRRQKEEEEEEVAGDGDGEIKNYRQVAKVSYYDLKQKEWISTVRIDVNLISMVSSLVLVDDNVFIVKSSSDLYRYDLVEKRITGKIEGLLQMKELTDSMMIRDVVYLGSCSGSDDKKYLKFCIFWECYNHNDKFMRFGIIKVGDEDVGDKLTVSISSSVGSFPVECDDYFIKGGAHKLLGKNTGWLDEQED